MAADLDDPGSDLINSMMVALRANTALMAIVTAIYDKVPTDLTTGVALVAYPYISLGPTNMIPDDFDCRDGEEVTIQWDVWDNGSSDAYSTVRTRKICKLIKQTLHDAELALTNNALVSLLCDNVRVIDDPNPAINHGIVAVTGQVEIPGD